MQESATYVIPLLTDLHGCFFSSFNTETERLWLLLPVSVKRKQIKLNKTRVKFLIFTSTFSTIVMILTR